MRKIENIVIHCSDSAFGCVREIRNWHLERGFKDIGYHFVILNGYITSGYYLSCLDGMIECGRYLDEDLFIEPNEVGAHALGYNDKSVGICLIGVKHFTVAQMNSLLELLKNIMDIYNIIANDVLGHYETASGKAQGKTCPNFDVEDIRRILRGDSA